MLGYVWDELNKEIQSRKSDTADLQAQERTGEAFSFPKSTLADAPLAADGMTTFAARFITDGRKGGEGAGLGTGCPAYFNPATDEWLRFSDDTAVTI